MTLERFPNESELAYHRRLIAGKVVDKTLVDCDYSEIAEKVYGQAYSSDVARRMMYGSAKTLQLMEHEGCASIGAQDILDEIEIKKAQLQVERQKFFDQRRERNKFLSAVGRTEHLEDRLVEAANRLNETAPLYRYTDPYVCDMDAGEAVLVLCDWHYGMTTDNVWNRYDVATCLERVEQVTLEAKRRLALHGCRKLHIVVLGDMVHGAIHTSARVTSEELVADQLMQVSEVLAQTIAQLADCVPETEVYVTYGNHARIVAKKDESVHRDNMERLIPWWLEWRLKERDDIVLATESDNEFLYLDVCGFGVVASHGDLDSVKGAPRLLSTLFAKKYGKPIDCVLLADKHHREEFEELGVSSIIAGALCGTDDYANGKRLYSSPEQLMLIFRPSYGLDATYHLKV